MKRRYWFIPVMIPLLAFEGLFLSSCSVRVENVSNNDNKKVPDDDRKNTTDDHVLSTGTIGVDEDTEYGNVDVEISIDEFNALGFCYGDGVDVRFSNGYILEDIPYYTGYYNPTKEPLVVGYPGEENIYVAINFGSLWAESGLTNDDTVEISLNSPGKYSDIQKIMSNGYEDDRKAYESDEVFANFRCVNTGRLRDDILYRSASPCDNTHNRAPYSDKLAAAAGIRAIVDLADEPDEIEGFIGSEDFDSPYFYSLYEKGAVIPVNLTVDYTSDDYKSNLGEALRIMGTSEGPYLVHCLEGKDRTGFVVALLEALTGASYDEMVADYMISFDNYYGIDEQSDPEAYDIILNNNFVPMIRYIAGLDKNDDILAADYESGAEAYLINCGMTGEEVSTLKEKLTYSPM